MGLRMFKTYRAMQKDCWCGAKAGERCRDRNGKTSIVHNTRGILDRKTIDALGEVAGVHPPARPAD